MLLAAQNDHSMMLILLLVPYFIMYGTHGGGIGVREASTSAECVLCVPHGRICTVRRKSKINCLPKKER